MRATIARRGSGGNNVIMYRSVGSVGMCGNVLVFSCDGILVPRIYSYLGFMIYGKWEMGDECGECVCGKRVLLV